VVYVERLLTKAQLRDAIVGIEDLPTGYSVDRDQASGEGNKTFCDYKVPHREKIKVFTDFIKGGGLSTELIVANLRQYASSAAAKESFSALTNTLKTCRSERSQGETVHYTLMSAPRLGDGSVGVRIEYDEGTNLSFFVLDGPVLINVGAGGVLNVDADKVASILKRQVRAYENSATR
jgi:prefoldin subunit 5